MKPFKTFKGIIISIDRANIDTDAIIPKQFLKSIKRTGFGENLFFDWRYLPDGKSNPDFKLNDPKLKGASVLVVRNNFGCGSSREHAVWAIDQYGIKTIIAPCVEQGETKVPAFADIFRNNCSKNGVLTVELSEDNVEKIFSAAEKENGIEATVNIEKQKIVFHAKEEFTFSFDMDSSLKERFIKGLDDIGITLKEEKAISDFEKSHDSQINL